MATATSRFRPTPDRPARPPGRSLRNPVLYAAATAYLSFLIVLGTSGRPGIVLAGALVVGPVLVLALGPERLGFMMLGLCFFLAAFARSPLLPEWGALLILDLILVAAWTLLLPRMLRGHVLWSGPLVLGVGLITGTGLIATIAAGTEQAEGLITLAGLVLCIGLIPLTMTLLRPSREQIRTWLWLYVGCQMLSTTYSFLQNPSLSARHQGFTIHPNAFAEAALLSFAALLFLSREARRPLLIYGCMGVCLIGIYVSGSRGATVALAILVVLIPVVERSALTSILLAGVAGIGVVMLTLLSGQFDPESSLGRLTGESGTAGFSDNLRADSLQDGIARFLEHPLTGSGFVRLEEIHNVTVEIIVGGGVFAGLGWLLIIWALGRPLLGTTADRRLAYLAVAYILFSSTAPSLRDRGAWLLLSLGIAIFRGYPDPPEPEPADVVEVAPSGARRSRTIPDMPGRVTR